MDIRCSVVKTNLEAAWRKVDDNDTMQRYNAIQLQLINDSPFKRGGAFRGGHTAIRHGIDGAKQLLAKWVQRGPYTAILGIAQWSCSCVLDCQVRGARFKPRPWQKSGSRFMPHVHPWGVVEQWIAIGVWFCILRKVD